MTQIINLNYCKTKHCRNKKEKLDLKLEAKTELKLTTNPSKNNLTPHSGITQKGKSIIDFNAVSSRKIWISWLFFRPPAAAQLEGAFLYFHHAKIKKKDQHNQ